MCKCISNVSPCACWPQAVVQRKRRGSGDVLKRVHKVKGFTFYVWTRLWRRENSSCWQFQINSVIAYSWISKKENQFFVERVPEGKQCRSGLHPQCQIGEHGTTITYFHCIPRKGETWKYCHTQQGVFMHADCTYPFLLPRVAPQIIPSFWRTSFTTRRNEQIHRNTPNNVEIT